LHCTNQTKVSFQGANIHQHVESFTPSRLQPNLDYHANLTKPRFFGHDEINSRLFMAGLEALIFTDRWNFKNSGEFA